MSENDILGRDPLKADRDSIWMKPASQKEKEKDYSKVIMNAGDSPEVPVASAARSMVKEGPALVSTEKPGPPPQAEKATPPAEPSPRPLAEKKTPESSEEEKGIIETVQMIGFKLGKEFFGISIINVQEIIRHQDITMVPRTPEFVEGVISLRGRVIPVINLRKRFAMAFAEKTKETRIVIVELDCGTVGFIVDAVAEVTSIPKKSIDPAPPTATGISKEYIQGVGKLENKLMIILDLNRVMSKESKQQLASMAA